MTPTHTRRNVIKVLGGGTAVTGLSGCLGGGGGSYPSRSIRTVVIFGAGGGLDRYTRRFTDTINKGGILDVEFEVEIVDGGGGLTGISEIYNSDPDGYTFGGTAPPIPNITAVKNPPGFDILELEQICQVGDIPGLLITHQDYGISDFGEMLEKYKSGEFSNVGTGWGAMGEVLLALLSEQKLEYENIIKYSGAGPTGKAVLNKEVPLGLASDAGLASAVENKAQGLAVLSDSGSKIFPDVPSITEFGFSSLPFGGVGIGYRFPPDTSADKVETLANAFEEASKTDEVQQWSEENGLKAYYVGPDETEQQMKDLKDAVNKYSDIITE